MKNSVSFLSGPVMISPKVSKAFANPAISHRSSEFLQMLQDTKNKLQTLTKAQNSTLMMGSGSLANEAIATHLSLRKDKVGLIISNGEFGERLIDQASRHTLNFKTLIKGWGEIFDYKEIEELLKANKIDWIWFVHCETSTGIMNDLEQIIEITKNFDTKVCIDCMSSIGIYKIDLSKIYLASASSNKGLESYAGIGIVFYNHEPYSNDKIPKYLDIGYYHQSGGIPFTFSSNLLSALHSSLDIILHSDKFERIKSLNDRLLDFLSNQNIKFISNPKYKSVSITTIKLDKPKKSEELGSFLQSKGFLIHYKNHYLAERNWIQIGFFSALNSAAHLDKLTKLIHDYINEL